MAIVKMNKLSVIGLETDKSALFEELMDLGVVELNDVSEKLLDKEWTNIAARGGEEDEVSKLEAKLSEVQTILDMIARYDTGKKPLLATRKVITKAEYQAVIADGGKTQAAISELNALYESWNGKKSEENVLVSTQASLMPWMGYELPVELIETGYVRIICGVIPAVSDVEQMKAKVAEVSKASEVTVISKDQEQQYLNILYMKADEEIVLDVMKTYGFAPTLFKDMTGTVQENMTKLSERLLSVREEEKELEARFAKAASMKQEVQYYYDQLIVERDKAKASENLLKTNKAFYFDGWVIAKRQKEVEAVLEKKGCWYEITAPAKDEETPVLLENTGMITPFETVTDLYSLPSSKEVDPTPIFSFFYFMFFGIMFADMGYGLILAVVCFAALKAFKLEGLFYKLIKMLAFCGVSTFIWGALFGGFFGNIITVIAENFFGKEILIRPLWFDPLNDPMKMLIFSCVLGGVHLFIGMGVKAYLLIRDGNWLDAVEDVFIWYVFLLGIVIMIFGGGFFPGASTVGLVMTAGGAGGIVLIRAFRGKGIGRLLGLWNLYGSTSYLGDVLSYSRLLALGLASAVIAQVFNALGSMLGNGIVGLIGFVIIAIVGHVFNFAINALGTFVHASRLQYVEFFGKFYEGGGVPFKPFKKNTKYVNIVKEEK